MREHTATSFAAPKRIAAVLSGYPHRWAIAGGWAIDLYLERETREHKDDPDFLELVLNEATATDFLFRRDPSLTLPLDRAFPNSSVGLPVLAPEVALLYKARHSEEPGNSADFASALASLEPASRAWLRQGIARLQPGHPWLQAL